METSRLLLNLRRIGHNARESALYQGMQIDTSIEEMAADCIEALIAERGNLHQRLQAAEQRNEWQPIETCPEEDVDVLFVEWDGDRPFYCVGSKWRGSFFISVDAPVTPKPTYWMPLPDPPQNIAAGVSDGAVD